MGIFRSIVGLAITTALCSCATEPRPRYQEQWVRFDRTEDVRQLGFTFQSCQAQANVQVTNIVGAPPKRPETDISVAGSVAMANAQHSQAMLAYRGQRNAGVERLTGACMTEQGYMKEQVCIRNCNIVKESE